MSDIFREVDEDIRRERLGRIWKRIAPFVYVIAILVVAGTGGYRAWEAWKSNQAEADGDVFAKAMKVLEEVEEDRTKLEEEIAKAKEEEEKAAENPNNEEGEEDTGEETEDKFAKFEAEKEALKEKKQEAYELFRSLMDASGGYPVLAKMRLATELALDGEIDESIKVYDEIIEDNTVEPLFRELSALRASFILLDGDNMDEVRDRILSLAGDDNPWRPLVWENLAFAEWKDGNGQKAMEWLDKLIEDEFTPRGVSRRAESMKRLLKSEGYESELDKKKEEEENESS